MLGISCVSEQLQVSQGLSSMDQVIKGQNFTLWWFTTDAGYLYKTHLSRAMALFLKLPI
jgi:hypothetical protein